MVRWNEKQAVLDIPFPSCYQIEVWLLYWLLKELYWGLFVPIYHVPLDDCSIEVFVGKLSLPSSVIFIFNDDPYHVIPKLWHRNLYMCRLEANHCLVLGGWFWIILPATKSWQATWCVYVYVCVCVCMCMCVCVCVCGREEWTSGMIFVFLLLHFFPCVDGKLAFCSHYVWLSSQAAIHSLLLKAHCVELCTCFCCVYPVCTNVYVLRLKSLFHEWQSTNCMCNWAH